MQLIIVIIILTCAIIYATFHFSKILTNKSERCYGCPLNEMCKKKGRTDKQYINTEKHKKCT